MRPLGSKSVRWTLEQFGASIQSMHNAVAPHLSYLNLFTGGVPGALPWHRPCSDGKYRCMHYHGGTGCSEKFIVTVALCACHAPLPPSEPACTCTCATWSDAHHAQPWATPPMRPGKVPAFLPWQQPASDGVPRFVCDIMAEGVARQLRMCGVDAASPALGPTDKRHIFYRQLVEASEVEGRVILTSDRYLAQQNFAPTYLLKGGNRKAQLREVLDAFGLTVERGELLSRCARCNGMLSPEALEALQLSPAAAAQVPPVLLERGGMRFWMCSTAACSKVYWQGVQYGSAVEHLAGRLGDKLVVKT